jgi:hypothetical protein
MAAPSGNRSKMPSTAASKIDLVPSGRDRGAQAPAQAVVVLGRHKPEKTAMMYSFAANLSRQGAVQIRESAGETPD